MILLTKKEIKKFENLYLRNLEKLEIKYQIIHKQDRDYMSNLIFEKSDLEKKIARQLKIIENLKTTLEEMKNSYSKMKLDFDDIKEKNICLKNTMQCLHSSTGGYKKEINKLRNTLGYQECYIEWAKKQLSRFKIKPPSIKELLEYEQTHKSPRK